MLYKYKYASVKSDAIDTNKFNIIFPILAAPLFLMYFEVILILATGLERTFLDWIYTFLYSLILGSVVYTVSSIFSPKVNRIIATLIYAVIGIVYAIYEVYFAFFKEFIDLGVAGEAESMFRDFLGNVISCILSNLHWIIAFFVPCIAILILSKRICQIAKSELSIKITALAFFIIIVLLRTTMISADNNDYGYKFYYTDGYKVTIAAEKFSLPTAIRLNVQYAIFGIPESDFAGTTSSPVDPEDIFTSSSQPPTSSGNTSSEEPFIPVDAVLDIDFNKLAEDEKNNTIKKMHQYFATVTPTQTNEYTGMFKGKNLIYITAEAFSDKVIDPVLTPTLYKIATQGFVFNNCYNGLWGGSTATGEYLSLTGLFYGSANCLKKSGGLVDGNARLMYYALGNTFSRENYDTYAFHNHNPNYYGRNASHPNFGFEFYGANGTYGSLKYVDGISYPTSAWPKSDYEMAKLSTPYYIDGNKPFCAYYMTVSGHADYSWVGNAMSKRNRDRVASLPYSEEVKAYYACSLELEDMLTELINQLTAKGILDDTVFVISADHYPYGFSSSGLAEFYGLPEEGITKNFDLYRNKFMIWSSSMEKSVVVNKYCSSMDIIPTVYNLFGINYDSRLLMGQDVLSDSDGLVLLNTHSSSWNWITDYGTYNTATGVFTPHEGIDVGDATAVKAYVDSIKSIVSGKRKYSSAIMDNDYYRYVFK